MNENLIEAATAISDALDYLFAEGFDEHSAVLHLETALFQVEALIKEYGE